MLDRNKTVVEWNLNIIGIDGRIEKLDGKMMVEWNIKMIGDV